MKNIGFASYAFFLISCICTLNIAASSDNKLISEKSSTEFWPAKGHVRTPPGYLFLAWQMTEGGVIAFAKTQFYTNDKGYTRYTHSYSHFSMPDFEWGHEEPDSLTPRTGISQILHAAFLKKSDQKTARWCQRVGENIVCPQSIALSYTTVSGDKLAVITPQFQPGYPRTEHGLPETNILRIYALTTALCKQPRPSTPPAYQDATEQQAEKSSEAKE